MTVYKVENHWKRMREIRDKTGKLPENALDFISVHYSIKGDNCFRFISPMKLVDEMGMRPEFERDVYFGKNNAFNAALKLAEMNNVFVVSCL